MTERAQKSAAGEAAGGRKAAALEALLRKKGIDLPDTSTIRRRPGSGPWRLSFAQERLWFLDRLMAGETLYNLAQAVRLHGDLDVAALADALSGIERRHGSLRTRFVAEDGEPFQVVDPPGRGGMPLVDLGGLPEGGRRMEAERLVTADADRPFRLDRGPLWRRTLVRTGPREHVLLLTIHHAVCDGWSLGILQRELTELYGAAAAGRPSALEPLPVRYVDFAEWQRERLDGEAAERQLDHWRERLAGAPPVLDLPLDRPRPPERTFRGGTVSFRLADDLSRRVGELGRRRKAGLFVTLLAAFQALVWRYTGQPDFVLGTPVAGRTREEVEDLIGLFVNTLVLRADCTGDPTWSGLLERTRRSMIEAQENQELPYERLVEELRPDRDVSHHVLFQVMFMLQNLPQEDLEMPGVRLSSVDRERKVSTFDLTVAFQDDDGRLVGGVEYDADLFDATTIERMIRHYEVLLEAATSEPDRPLAALPLATRAERHQVVREWRRSLDGRPDTGSETVVDWITRRAREVPDAVALETEDEEITYGVLDGWSRDLARRLAAAGVGTGDRVAVLLPRSPELIASFLGVLRAGGLFVALDPERPVKRLGTIVSDAEPAALVAGDAPDWARMPVVRPGAPPAAEPAPEVAVAPRSEPGDGAYLVYTSGTTGTPKGVLVEHSALAAYTRTFIEMNDLGPADRVLQFQAVTFDACIEEIFPTLSVGATLVLRDDSWVASPGGCFDACRRRAITLLSLPTAFWHELAASVDGDGDGLPGSVRSVLFGGEKVSPGLVERWVRAGGHGDRLFNTYGPAEATVVATAAVLAPGRDLAAELARPEITIGRPLPGVRVHVLDRALRPVPIGLAGELQLGGVGLARGYLARPSVTAERFVPDPFAARPGERLYRTGDLVRFRPDGELEFVGRADHQVKIRGHRVEIGAVERALIGIAGVREAAVELREVAPGDHRLVAYVVPENGTRSRAELEADLAERLPRFMMPGAWVTLDALPLTGHDKVDRRALPDPPRRTGVDSGREPWDRVERELRRIWQEVLGVEPVPLTSSFFDLGGHSLLAVRLLDRVEKRLGRQLSLASLIRWPTVADQARLLREAPDGPGGATAEPPLVPLRTDGDRPPITLVHPVGGHVHHYLPLVRHLPEGQPVFGLQAPVSREGRAREDDAGGVPAMAARYLDELDRSGVSPPYRLAGWSMGGTIAFEMAARLEERGDEVDLLALLDAVPPAPDGPRPAAGADDELRLLADFGREMGLTPEALRADHDPGDQEARLAALLDRCSAAGVLPPDLGPDRFRSLYRVFRENVRALRRYAPERRYGGDVDLVWAADDPGRDHPAEAARWRNLVGGDLRVHEVPGDHYDLPRAPVAARVAAILGDLTAPDGHEEAS